MKKLKINKEMEKIIYEIFDVALKSQGLQVAQLVNQVIAAIKEE